MPTGYTAVIADGITFEQFAMRCARIPERFEPTTYYADVAATARAELASLAGVDADVAALSEYTAATSAWAKRVAERADLRAKYDVMLSAIEAWAPPTDKHAGLKEFMRSQVADSINCDCDGMYDTPPVRLSGAEWLAQRTSALNKSIEYRDQMHAEEVARVEQRNAWLAALRASL